MKVAQLTIEMAANVARLQKDMAQAQRSVEATMGRIQKSADSAMRALGAIGIGLSVGAFANWIKGAIDAIDKLNDISAATGITVTKLAGLDYAAKLSGTNLEAMTQASNKLQLSLTTNNAALAKVGVTAQDPIEALVQLADVYAATEGQSNKAAVASLALGKSWQSIAGVLAQGGDGLRRLIAEGEALSGVTEETARDAGKFNDEIDKLTTRLGALALNIAGPILKVFSEFIDELNEGTKAAGGFWKAIGMFGTTNPFATLEESVAKYKKEVEELTEKQEKYGELAALAFGTNEKLATATQRLAYFEAMLAIEKRKSAAAMAEGASGANAHVAAYNAMTASADELLEQMRLEFLLIGLTNEERAVSIGMRKLEEIGIRQGTDAFEKYMKEIMEIQKHIGIKKEMVRLSEEAAKNAKREGEEYDRLVKSFQEQIAKMQIENETYFAGNAARERAIFLRETENLKIEDRSRLLAQYDEAAAIKAANEARKKGIEKQLEQQKDYAKEMEKINDQIGQSLTDALMNGGMKARDFIVNLFKTMILRPVLQPIIGAVTGAVTSLFAGSALAGGTGAAGASSMTQAGSLMGLVSAGKTAYEVVAGGFNSVGTAASNLAATFMGQNLAVNAALIEGGTIGTAGAALESSALATSQMAGSVGLLAKSAAGIAAGIMAGKMISGQFKVGGSAYLMPTIGAIIGSIWGPIGGAIGGAIGGLVNRAFGMGEEKVSRTGLELRPTISGTEALGFLETEQKGGWFRGDKWNREIVALGQDATDFFNQTAISVGGSIAAMTKSLGISIDEINKFEMFTMVVDTLGKTDAEIQARILEVFGHFENALTGFLIPSIMQFQRSSEETASTILKRLYTSLVTVNQTFEVLGYTLYDMNLQSADASQKLIDLFGGLENFSKSTSFYYENFYSAQEKVNFQTEQLTKIFGSLGLALPSSNNVFRQMVEAAQAAGNDQLFATLVQLAPAFNTLQVSLAQLPKPADVFIDSVEEITEIIGLSAEELKRIADERYGLETKLLELQGDTVALRARERSALYESNRALLDQIYVLEDAAVAQEQMAQAAQEASQKAEQAAQELASKLKAIADERYSLDTRLLQAQNDTQSLRERELQALDESNRALLKQIFVLQDAATAQEELAQAAQQAAEDSKRAAEELIAGLQRIYDESIKATDLAFDKLKNALQKQLDETIALEKQKLDQALAVIEKQREAANVAKDVASESIASIKDIFGVLNSEINSLSDVTSIAQNSVQARQFITSALVAAQATGYLPSADDLARAITQARTGMGAESFGSSFEMRRDNLRLQNELILLRDVTGEQLTGAEKQLQIAEQTLESLDKQAEDAQAFYEKQIALAEESYNSQLDMAQKQLDALRGIDDSVLSLSAAMTNFASAIGAEISARSSLDAATRSITTPSRADQIFDLYDKVLERAPDPEGFKYWMESGDTTQVLVKSFIDSTENRIQEISRIYKDVLDRAPDIQGLNYWLGSSDTLDSIKRNIMMSEEAQSIRGFANGGQYSGGMAMVGERGPEMIDFSNPGMVYSNERLRSAMGGADMATEIRALREDNRIQSRAMVSMQSRMTRLIERWDGDGLPTERYEDATA